MRSKRTKDDKDVIKIVSNNVKFYRINNNCSEKFTDKYGRISQEKLAELSNISTSMIANVEAPNVDVAMSISFLRKISEALNIPLYAFFLEKPYKNPSPDPRSDTFPDDSQPNL